MFKFQKERLKKRDRLGKGSSGAVFPYQKDDQDMEWVLKRIKAEKTEEILKCIPEIALGFSCDHPCIVPVKGYSIVQKEADGSKHNIYLKLPRMDCNLAVEFDRRRKNSSYFSEEELVKHFYRLVSGLEYLHNKEIFHGDIKANNILLDKEGNVKLSDIGSAKYVPYEDYSQILTGAKGCEKYKAPEIINHEKALREYNSKAAEEKKNYLIEDFLKKEDLFLTDYWSLGLVMLEACILKTTKVTYYDLLETTRENLRNERHQASKQYSDILLNIIFDLLEIDSEKRLSASEVKVKLEENFKGILTKKFQASAILQKQSQQDSEFLINYFQERAEKKDTEIRNLKQQLKGLHHENSQTYQEDNQVSKEDDEILQALYNENTRLFELLQAADRRILELQNPNPNQSQNANDIENENEDEDEARKAQILNSENASLKKVSTELNEKWSQWFDITGDPYLAIEQKANTLLASYEENFLKKRMPIFLKDKLATFAKREATQKRSNLVFKEFIKDLLYECSEENLLDSLNRFKIQINQDCNLTDESLHILASKIVSRLTNVKCLLLDLSSWSEITDEGLKELTRQLKPKLPNLTAFTLRMKNWNQITDQGLTHLSTSLLSQLTTSVRYLELDLGGWKKITDEGFNVFASYFGPNLAEIECLILSFWLSDELTIKSLGTLAENINENLSKLKKITFCLNNRDAATDSVKKCIKDQFKNIPQVIIN